MQRDYDKMLGFIPLDCGNIFSILFAYFKHFRIKILINTAVSYGEEMIRLQKQCVASLPEKKRAKETSQKA